MTKLSRCVLLLVVALSVSVTACGPGPEDAAGQASLLSERGKRNAAFQAIQQLFHKRLEAADSDRANPEVKAVIDATIEPLAQSYIGSAGDRTYGRFVLELLAEMRDARALPAYLKALEVELDAGEREAQTAANALRDITIPDGQKAAVVTALVSAINKLPGDRAGNDVRPADKVVQIDLVKSLGSVGEAAAPALATLLETENPKVDPAVTLASAIYLGNVSTTEQIPALVKCLFRSIAGGRVPLIDYGIAGLIRVGQPAVQPLIAVMRGQDQAANAAAAAALSAARAAGGGSAPTQTAATLTRDRGMRALAALGAVEAFPHIAEAARTGEVPARVDATLMLMQLPTTGQQATETRSIVEATVAAASGPDYWAARSSMISVMLQTFDASFLPLALSSIRNRDEYGAVRVAAVTTFAMLADKDEAQQLRPLIEAEPPLARGGGKEPFKEIADPLLAVAVECDQNLGCWRGKLSDSNAEVVRKAIMMLGRYGSGNAESVTALLPLLDHARADVRIPALYALDHLVKNAEPAVIEKLTDLSERDDDVSAQVKSETLRILSRIRNRGAR